MSKRPADGDDVAVHKRQKTGDRAQTAVEEVTSARQLQELLIFQQDAIPQLSRGIKQLKLFLESIVYATDKTTTLPQQTILKEYLESQTPRHGADSDTPFLPNLTQTWSFAAQANNDGLQSATSSVLALLLKTISTLIEFRDLGTQLCKTLLQQAQLKLISRALSAPRHKEHIISPCLRLLTEIVTFDGGAMAKTLWSAKTFTFDGKILARNLSLWKTATDDVDGNRRRPSVRSNTLRYILANLKFQSSSVKSDILKYGNVLRPLFELLVEDSADHLQETLEIIKIHVLMDESIPRNIKGYVLSEHNLSGIASIYRREQSPTIASLDRVSPDTLAHTFLHFACTNSSAGILRTPTGWYPSGTDKKQADVDNEDDEAMGIDLGLASVDWYDRYHKHVPIRNGTLGTFAQILRPFANVQECQLLIDILRAAPELVADYFFKKSGFAFDPKLTATWIGYSSFLFLAVQLPVPIYFGRKDGYYRIPPPVSIVIENILPQPLSQKVLTKCLNQQVDLITFFALRLLLVSFEKLREVLAVFKEAAKEGNTLWDEASERLVTAFTLRCPKMKDVIGTFRKTPVENTLQREASLRLLLVYYDTIPQVAFEEKFDVSLALADAMDAFQKQSSTIDVVDVMPEPKRGPENLQLLELSHLLRIARWSPDMRWWNKPENMKFSPFITLLKVVSSAQAQNTIGAMRQLLFSIISEYGILLIDRRESALKALVASLRPHKNFLPSDGLFTFLDDVIGRLTRKPIKYQDDMDRLVAEAPNSEPVSLLLMTLLEQWPFACKSESSLNIAEWLGRFLQCLGIVGEDAKLLSNILKTMSHEATSKHQCKALTCKDNQELNTILVRLMEEDRNNNVAVSSTSIVYQPPKPLSIDAVTFAPSSEDPKHSGLHRWSTTDPASAISSGFLFPLILHLSSTESAIRRLALTNLNLLMTRLPPLYSTFPDGPQFYLLLGILTTTARPYIVADTPVPHLCTVYAALAATTLLEPLHPLYDKICRFHTKAPKWDVERLPSYWTHQILYTAPAEARDMPLKYTPSSQISSATTTTTSHPAPSKTSLLFLLNYLYTSLATPADLEILRKRGTFEPILASAAANPFWPRDCRQAALKLLWRATCIDGGSTMLITRKGIMSWIGGKIAVAVPSEAKNIVQRGSTRSGGGGGDVDLEAAEALRLLAKRLWETCDRKRVDTWSGGLMEGIVARLVTG